MVTTRSAEKRLAASGRVEELVVRPKANETLSSPTPPPGKTRKRADIMVNVPPGPPKPSKLSNNTFETSSVDGEDDSSYLTAKESPESSREAEASDHNTLVTPTTASQIRKPLEIPSSQETFTSPTAKEFFTPVGFLGKEVGPPVGYHIGMADLRQHEEPPEADKLSSATTNNTHNVHVRRSARIAEFDNTKPVSENSSPIVSDNGNDEDAPEILSNKRRASSLVTVTPKRKKKGITISTSDVIPTNEDSILDNSDHQAHLEVKNSKTSKSTYSTEIATVTNGVLPAQSFGALVYKSQEPDRLSGSQTEPTQVKVPTSHLNGARRSPQQVDKNLLHKENYIPISMRSQQVGPTTAHRTNIPLPIKASKTLEAYRRRLLLQKASGKRSRRFRFTDDWNAKRRKFVVA